MRQWGCRIIDTESMKRKKKLFPNSVDENILFLSLKIILHAIDMESVSVNIPKYSGMCWWEAKQRSDTCQDSSSRHLPSVLENSVK